MGIINCVLSDAGFYVELTVNAANDCSNSDSEISADRPYSVARKVA